MRAYLIGTLGFALAVSALAPAFVQADAAPPLELLDSNFAQTPYTACVQIDRVEKVSTTTDAHSRTDGYITFRVHATVLERFKGAARAKVDYLETHEAPSAGPRAGAHIVVSLQREHDGTLFVPDNGYVFPATPAVLERARNNRAAMIRREHQRKN